MNKKKEVPVSKKKEALDRKKNDEDEINKILAYINNGKKLETTIIRFKPKSESETVTPILIKFKDEKTRNEILHKAKILRDKSAFEKIYLNPDLTLAQQHNFKQLREQCKELNERETDKDYVHVIRNNNIRRVLRRENNENPRTSRD